MRFKILMSYCERKAYPDCPDEIDWKHLEPYRDIIENNHGQTLERLNERGGPCPREIMCAIWYGRLVSIRDVTMEGAIKFIIKNFS